MSEADNKVIKEKKIPLDAPCHLADTVDSSFVEEMDSVSESVNNLLIRTAIMKVTNHVHFKDAYKSMDISEKENEREQSEVKYSIADLKALLPHNTICTSDQNTSYTLMEAINYIKKLQAECVQRQALTDRLNEAYNKCMDLALRLQHLKKATSVTCVNVGRVNQELPEARK